MPGYPEVRYFKGRNARSVILWERHWDSLDGLGGYLSCGRGEEKEDSQGDGNDENECGEATRRHIQRQKTDI